MDEYWKFLCFFFLAKHYEIQFGTILIFFSFESTSTARDNDKVSLLMDAIFHAKNKRKEELHSVGLLFVQSVYQIKLVQISHFWQNLGWKVKTQFSALYIIIIQVIDCALIVYNFWWTVNDSYQLNTIDHYNFMFLNGHFQRIWSIKLRPLTWSKRVSNFLFILRWNKTLFRLNSKISSRILA